MIEIAREVLPVNLEEEMRKSYLDYAMSVIVGRALPDVRDGLKPVHRRVLFAMRELGNDWNKAYKKSARVVGDVIGKYHPHGDASVYDAIVRMAQAFSMRYMLVDGQGNFGSVDGDMPAAMRYTEVRMARITHELLADIEKETVDFNPNYDESESEPSVLPARIPNLLLNGSSGIAVGMATNIPPHNAHEILSACIALIDSPNLSLGELMQIVPGPDFPTAGIINGAQEIIAAYKTGRGRLHVRARTHFEDIGKGDRQSIVITELPYQVNKARLIERIADLVREKLIEGIASDGLRDESDKDGMRIVIEMKRGEVPEILLNNLFAQTPMETVFGVNMVALVDGQPRLLSLKEMLDAFLRHRREVVTRRTVFELRKARERGHILEGLSIALANIDEVIATIKASASPAEAKVALVSRVWQTGVVPAMLARAGEISTRPDGEIAQLGLVGGGYKLTETQAQAILDMRLNRLTGLEQDKIVAEYEELLKQIVALSDILARPERLLEVIREELVQMREAYADKRRTEIISTHEDLTLEDLISPEEVVVTLSHGGYAKAQPVSDYQAQRRGGRGKAATSVKDEDFVDKLFVANTHDTLLCFSDHGKLYWLKVYQLPQASRGARGKPIVNILPLSGGERISALLPIKEFEEGKYVFMATSLGTVKKTSLAAFSRPRANGIIAVALDAGDQLVGAAITDGTRDILLCTSAGKAIRFFEDEVRAMGREAAGVRGVKLAEGQRVNALIVIDKGFILTASENGFGKLSPIDDFPKHGRGGQGVIALQLTERNGSMVGALQVTPEDEIMLMSQSGALVRTPVRDISIVGRNTQGVRLIRLEEGDRLSGLERIDGIPGEEPTDPADPEGAPTLSARIPSTTLKRLVRPDRLPLTFSQLGNSMRIFNFAAGPAVLPTEVLEQAKNDLPDWNASGMSVMEVSHRSKAFVAVASQAELDLRELLAIPSNYKVLFLQGGATGQFAFVPMNLAGADSTVDYINTGHWSKKAIGEAKRYCKVNVAADAGGNYSTAPAPGDVKPTPGAAYLHYTPNETIGGVEFGYIPDSAGAPLVADMSSTILSRPIDVSKFGLIYAGAQKNIGPSGLVVVIVRDDLIGKARPGTPSVFDYKAMADDNSMLNTPPTFAWYMAGLVFKWLKKQGGLTAIAERNRSKAEKLYSAIDASNFYASPVAKNSRSWMNVPFTLAKPELEKTFLQDASGAGLKNLEGHRSVGGMRASIYNAMSVAGVDALVDFMRAFEKTHA